MATKVVSPRLRSVFRVHVGLVVAESVLVAASVGGATMAATIVSMPRAPSDETQRLAVAILAAVLAANAGAHESDGDTETMARAIDRQRGLGGAVLTAFQSESAAGPSTSVAQLLAARISLEVSPLSFLRASWRASAPLLALPWFAIAIWSLAAERAGISAPGNASAASPASVATTGIHARVAAVRDAADRIARTPGLAPDLEAVSRRISEEADRVARTAAERPSARSDEELRDLERRLDLVRNAIPLEAVTSRDPRGRMTGPDRGTEPAPDARMPEAHPLPPVPSPATDPNERGVLASKWWGARYDAVVARWLETRRQLPENRPR